jgi:HD superfamily phosphohydrolase
VAKLGEGELRGRLEEIGGPGLAAEIGALIRGVSASPLQGLISGSLDLDKIDYLSRDARMCGVPYGTVDVDRLLATLTLVETAPARYEVGVLEKGVSALESLLFAKYQMYRNVYWHHAVRSATCMFKRAVRRAVARDSVTVEEIAEATDDGLMDRLITRDGNRLAAAIRARRLYKRALDLPASDVPGQPEAWVAEDPDLLERVEDAVAVEVGLAPGELLLDFPARSSMLGVDLPLLTRGGSVERLTDAGRAGQLGLPRVADELYRSARRLRVFVRDTPGAPLRGIPDLLACPAGEMRRRLDQQSPLLERSSVR